jgi:hypothetical protein
MTISSSDAFPRVPDPVDRALDLARAGAERRQRVRHREAEDRRGNAR